VDQPDDTAREHAAPGAVHEAAIEIGLRAGQQRAVHTATQVLAHPSQRCALVEVARVTIVEHLRAAVTNGFDGGPDC
jgi:hypothetical protein